jgi:glycosyltransferase involved in cell wall biosynthesis
MAADGMQAMARSPEQETGAAPPKKVAVLVPGLYGGGAERAMLKLARGISARGYPVDLVLARAEGPYLTEIPESVRLVDLCARRVLASLPPLVRYLRGEEPDALLSVLHANVVALWARRLARVPTRVIVSERNTLSSAGQHYASDLRMRLTPYLKSYFYPWADGIVAVSEGVADDLAQMTGIPREQIQVIYNPIVTPELHQRAQVSVEHAWFKPGQPPVVLAVGRLTVQKDFATLIRAFAWVRQTRRARLLILGEGADRPALEALVGRLGVSQDVSLPGFVLNPYSFMAQASVFVLSSRWEGLPGAVIEALYCGAPVVATDCPGGPREILGDGEYGRLVPVGDSVALSRAIEATLADNTPPAPRESWLPFELGTVVDQYVSVLFGS